MNCPNCDRTIPADAAFCIYCSAAVGEPRPAPVQEPVTGATIQLDKVSPALPPRSQPPRPPRPVSPKPAPQRSAARPRRRSDPSAAIFFVGLAVLFATRTFWPGILILLGVTSYVSSAARGRRWQPPMMLIWFIGLAFLFWAKIFWPGILLLILLTHVLGNRKRAFFP